jgi:RND family efflux transporter MFP subunit
MRRALPSLLLLGTIGVAGCKDANAKTEGIAPIPVKAAIVETAASAAAVGATGTLTGKEEIALAFKIGGIVAKLTVEPGQSVKAGDLLAELTPTEIGAEVEKARQGRAKALRDVERVKKLYADSVATLEQLQDATTGLQVAESNLKIAEFNKDFAVIRAPFDGVVLQRNAEVSQLVSPGQMIVQLRTARRGLVVRAGLPDRDVLRVHLGDRAELRFAAMPDVRFTGTVTQVAVAATSGTGTYPVEIAVSGGDRVLIDGLVADVRIGVRGGASGPVLPVESLLEADGDSASVFVLSTDNQHAERRAVRIGALGGRVVPVQSGVKAGERVVVAGAAYLTDGARITLGAAKAQETKP